MPSLDITSFPRVTLLAAATTTASLPPAVVTSLPEREHADSPEPPITPSEVCMDVDPTPSPTSAAPSAPMEVDDTTASSSPPPSFHEPVPTANRPTLADILKGHNETRKDKAAQKAKWKFSVVLETGQAFIRTPPAQILQSFARDHGNKIVGEFKAAGKIGHVSKLPGGNLRLLVTTEAVCQLLANETVTLLGNQYSFRDFDILGSRYFLDIFGLGSEISASTIMFALHSLGCDILYENYREAVASQRLAMSTYRVYFRPTSCPAPLLVSGNTCEQLCIDGRYYLARGKGAPLPADRLRMGQRSPYCLPLPVKTPKPKEFLKKIGGTSSHEFFTNMFEKTIPELPKGKKYCAVFDFDGTVVSNALLTTVFEYQIQHGLYVLKAEDVPIVFGFSGASKVCIPKESLLDGIKAREEKKKTKESVKVSFDDVVMQIQKIFDKREKEPLTEEDNERLEQLVFVWYAISNKEMAKQPQCRYLKHTLQVRLLHQMNPGEREELMRSALQSTAPPRTDNYHYETSDGIAAVRVWGTKSAPYDQMVALINALKTKDVTSYIISATHKEYLLFAIKEYHIKINPGNLYGSRPDDESEENMLKGIGVANEHENKVKTVEDFVSSKCRVIVAAGDTMNDAAMLRFVTGEGGQAFLLLSEKPKGELAKLANEVLVQYVDPAVPEWKKETTRKSDQ
uniref:AlNc14C14G1633 protein n=1 Tax=Albugo laibachii Nc14 TaxID=890382 RepID=F0W3P6_9STRA|nr:AlNc14C14G1633 [Albugo laibachii Nc14]|eukprot:CCA15716.1 AlNc14C14G1633 [Albugo laibachii Nc14]